METTPFTISLPQTRHALVLALGLAALTAGAQGTPGAEAGAPAGGDGAAPAALPIKDYSRGFQKFYEYGLPDVGKAQYVTLSVTENDPFESDEWASGMFGDMQLAGNAWLLSYDEKTGKGLFIMGPCRLVEAYDAKILQKLRAEKAGAGGAGLPAALARMAMYGMSGAPEAAGDDRKAATWKEADLAKDVARTVAYWRKKTSGRERDTLRQYGRMNVLGTPFLSAIHFYKKGYTNEANQIAGMLFSAALDSKEVIVQGLNVLADSQYDAAFAAFSRGKDWAGFEKGLDALLARFKSGWLRSPAVSRLAGEVRKCAQRTQPPPVEGTDLTDEDRRLAAALADAPPRPQAFMYLQAGSLWILKPAPGSVKEPRPPPGAPAAGAPHVIDRITARGMKSVPLLLALLKDDWLTTLDRMSVNPQAAMMYRGGMFNMDSSETSPEEQAEKAYEAMRRPLSRGDVAADLLRPLMIAEEHRRGGEQPDRAQVAEWATAWYAENGRKAPNEVALAYLKDGDSQQQNAAMQYLVRSTNEADIAAIEQRLLESRNRLQESIVDIYVRQRGSKAAAFVETYIAALRKNPANAEIYNDPKDLEEAVSNKTVSLRQLTTPPMPFRQLVDEIAEGKKSFDESAEAASRSLAREEPEAAIAALLEGALRAKQVQDATSLIGFIQQAAYARMQQLQESGDMEEMMAMVRTPPAPPDIKTHAPLWRKALADTRSAPSMRQGGGGTVGDFAAAVIETLYAGEDATGSRERWMAAAALGARLKGIMRERALARLDGKDSSQLPAFPSAEDVTKEQREQLAARIAACADDALAALVKGLKAGEILALIEMTKGNAALNARLSGPAHAIVAVRIEGDSAGRFKETQTLQGKRLDSGAVRALFDACRQAMADSQAVSCSIQRQSGLGGVEIAIALTAGGKPAEPAVAGVRRRARLPARPGLQGWLSGGGFQAHATWSPAAPGTERRAAAGTSREDALLAEALTELDGDIAQASKDAEAGFWTQTADLCAGKGNVCQAAAIRFAGTLGAGN